MSKHRYAIGLDSGTESGRAAGHPLDQRCGTGLGRGVDCAAHPGARPIAVRGQPDHGCGNQPTIGPDLAGPGPVCHRIACLGSQALAPAVCKSCSGAWTG